MKIRKIEAQVLVWPVHEPMFWMSIAPATTRSELVVRVHTDEGITGIGHVDPGSAFRADERGNLRAAGPTLVVQKEFAPSLAGEDPLDTERLWHKMFASTYRKGWGMSGWSRNDIMTAIAAVDMALWDVKGKAVKLPLYKLLGASRTRVQCYVAGGYYREGKTIRHLAAECRRYVRDGFKAIKMRVGGASLEEDVERVRAVREAVGPDVKLMLDANGAYDFEAALQAAKAYMPMDIFWFEEPVRWYDEIGGSKRLSECTGIPIAAGEQARNRWEAADLLAHAGIRFMQFDCMNSGGPSEWLKVAAMCSALDIPMAPHHGPNIHAHMVAAVPNGAFVEYFPNPKDYRTAEDLFPVRYDLMREAFAVFPEIEGGDMVLSDRPGWGFELDEDVVRKRAVKA
jgi:L-alanine-DL-glutamate epimerase-like enolase superfamily enzyme